VIVSVANGKPLDVNAFIADKHGGPFKPEPLEVA
jgi:hypothetical protein